MRILLVNDGATPVGGAEMQALRTRELLRDAGHEVRLFASRVAASGTVPEADALAFGTTHRKLRVVTETVNPSAVRALRAELATFRPDVVHVRMFLTQLSPLILPLLAEVPTVWQVVYYKAICPRGTKVLPDGSRCAVPAGTVCLRNRCVTPQSWVLAMLQQRLWRHWRGAIDQVITLSETMRGRLQAEGIDDVEVIPNGVRERPARPALESPPTVAFAGRLVPEKGADVLLHAFASLRDAVPDARLLVAGTGPEAIPLATLATRLGIADRTTFLGHLDQVELERRLDTAWVQAVPGRWDEPLGNVTLEAMMRGTAVVASAVGGPGEVVDDGRTGLLVPPGIDAALADALRALLTDRARCEVLGAAGRDTALERYGEARLVARLEAVYRGLLRPVGPGGPRP